MKNMNKLGLGSWEVKFVLWTRWIFVPTVQAAPRDEVRQAPPRSSRHGTLTFGSAEEVG